MNGENENLECPEKLTARLRELAEPKIFVPPTLDESILKAAQTHLEHRRRDKRGFDWTVFFRLVTAAAVAAVLIVASIKWAQRGGEGRNRPHTLAITDVNGDGRVDILDAFALARRLKGGAALDGRLDLNHDGRVDEQDVRALAAEAVRLDKRNRS